jgi:hypothetical protein
MSFMTEKLRMLLEQADQSTYECYTTRLWEYVLSRVVCKTDDWAISSQQPPTKLHSDLRRVDLLVEKWDSQYNTFSRILYMEAKHANPSTGELQTVEYQSFTAALAHCDYFNVDRVAVMTAAGGFGRLWVYERHDDYLTPWLPDGDGLGEIDEYIYLGGPQGNALIKH